MLLRQVGRGIQPRGVKRTEVRPTPIHKPVALIIVLVSALVIGLSLANGLDNAYLTACIIGFPALILASLFISGAASAAGKQRAIRYIPEEPAAHSATELRQRANAIAATAVHELQAAEPQTAAVSLAEPRRARTYSQGLTEAELNQRMLRVAAIIVAPCPACGVQGEELCAFVQGETVYLLDRERHIAAHGKRIGNALKTRTAKASEVVAQFDSSVPDDVWEAALDDMAG